MSKLLCNPTVKFANSLFTLLNEQSKFQISYPFPMSFQRIRPSLTPRVTFRNKLDFYGEELLEAPRPTS